MPRPSLHAGDVADLHLETTARHNKSRFPSSRLNNNYDTDSSDVAYTPRSSEEHTALPHSKVAHTMPSSHPHLENKDDGARERVARHITARKLAKSSSETVFDGHSTSSSEVNGRYCQSQEWPARRECDLDACAPHEQSMLRNQSYGWESKAHGFQDDMPTSSVSWDPAVLAKYMDSNFLRVSLGEGVRRSPADLSGVATLPLHSSHPVRDHMHVSPTQGRREGLTEFLEQELAKAKKELGRTNIVDEGRHAGLQLSPRQKVQENHRAPPYPYGTPVFPPTLMTLEQVRAHRKSQQYADSISPSLQHEQPVHTVSDNVVWDLEPDYYGLRSTAADPCGSGECEECDECGLASIAGAQRPVYSNPAWATHPSFEHSVRDLPACRPYGHELEDIEADWPSPAQAQDCTLHSSQSVKFNEYQPSTNGTNAQSEVAKLMKTTHGQFSMSEATEVLKMCHGQFRMAEAMYHGSGVEFMRHMLGTWQSETCIGSITQDTESHADSSGDAASGADGSLASNCRGCRNGCDACCPIGVEQLSLDDDYNSDYGQYLDATSGKGWGISSELKVDEDCGDSISNWGCHPDIAPLTQEPPVCAFSGEQTSSGCRWSRAGSIPKEDERECTPTTRAASAKSYIVTYWATIESGNQTVHIPIDNNNISGPEKAILQGPAKTVWKWIQEKGLGDKVGLQDAFDLAKDIQIGGEDITAPATGHRDDRDDCPSHQEPECSGVPGSYGPDDWCDNCCELPGFRQSPATSPSQGGWGV